MAAERIKTTNCILKLSIDKIDDFCQKIDDLTKINDKISLKFESDKMLMFSYKGQDDFVHAFKSHTVNIDEYFLTCKKGDDFEFIINNGKKFQKTIKQFTNYREDISIKIIYNEDGYGDKIMIKNDKLKFENNGGLPLINQNIEVSKIEELMDIENSLFSFKLKEIDFKQVKTLSMFDKDEEIYFLSVKEKKVYIGQKTWHLELDEVDYENVSISFMRNYFNTMVFNEDFNNIYVFNGYIVTLGKNSNLLLSLEANY